MSTEAGVRAGETRGSRRRRRERSGFVRSLSVVLAVLLVAAIAGSVLSLTQGPRASTVVVDTEAIAESAGQRVVFTASQPLEQIDPAQITVEPAAPYSVETSGRHVAVQFTYALDPDTSYEVTIDDVVGTSGGPESTLSHDFTTAVPPLYVLQRSEDGDDAVFLTNLEGDRAVPVFTHGQIEDFRESRSGLVVQTTDDDGAAALTVTARDGGDPTPLSLPGAGTVSGLQAADRGGLIGYTYTDLDVSDEGGIESRLYLSRMDDPGTPPRAVDLGDESRVSQWSFVPDTSSLLVLTFDGQLRLVDPQDPDASPVSLGTAISLSGVERGTGRAIVERADGMVTIDLTDLSEEALVTTTAIEELGLPGPVRPFAEGETLRTFTRMGADGYPESQSVVTVGPEGEVAPVLTLADSGDAVMQACASPSGRYAAVTVAPDLAQNPYDTYARPLPVTLQTHIIDTDAGETITVIDGTDVSWCPVAP
ncbi:hypothetical protein M4I32_04895 [Microbacterium sp. LRZ72]|uniref:hypothetical protein n=1 Tax=Microbacterium sp. LRZ72 TaxID=2942481 RepID=UPI0029B91F5A|nr:hypothetical protein [Microbacterium sp. LRZ72]MDX2376134.1 hypothetical protein [Microbacterium sp. LRZ72]